MSVFRTLYPTVEARLLEQLDRTGQIHGSAVRDLFMNYAEGRFAVDDHAERLLTELVTDGILVHGEQAHPTTSQGAFAGLAYSRASYARAGWAPGLKEHFYYFRKPAIM